MNEFSGIEDFCIYSEPERNLCAAVIFLSVLDAKSDLNAKAGRNRRRWAAQDKISAIEFLESDDAKIWIRAGTIDLDVGNMGFGGLEEAKQITKKTTSEKGRKIMEKRQISSLGGI